MKLNQRGIADVVVVASWLIIAGFLGLGIVITSALMTGSKRTDLNDYKAIHEEMPKDYDKMNSVQKREYWRKFFDERGKRGG